MTSLNDMIGPPGSAMGAPISPEMQDIMPQMAKILAEDLKEPDYEFRGIGQGLVGGLFNLLGGIFGNDDLGGQLFGRRSDNPADLASALLQYSGMQQQAQLQREANDLQRELVKQQGDIAKEMRESQQKHEIKLADIRFDQTKQAIDLEWNRKEKFAALESGDRQTMLRLEAALRRGHTDQLHKQDLEKMMAGHLFSTDAAERAAMLEYGKEFALRAQEFGYQDQFRKYEEKFRQEEEHRRRVHEARMQKRELRFRAQENEKQIESAEKIAGQKLEADTAAANARAGTEDRKLELEERKQRQSETQDKIEQVEEAKTKEGEKRRFLDLAKDWIDKNEAGEGNDLLHPDGQFDILKYSNTLISPDPDPQILDEIREKTEEVVRNAFLSDPTASPEDIIEKVRGQLTSSMSVSKRALMEAKKINPVTGEIDREISDSAYGEIDTALGRTVQLATQDLPQIAMKVGSLNQVANNIRAASTLVSSGMFHSMTYGAENPTQLQEELTRIFRENNGPSITDDEPNDWSRKVGSLSSKINNAFAQAGATDPTSNQVRNILLGQITGDPTPLSEQLKSLGSSISPSGTRLYHEQRGLQFRKDRNR